MVNVFPHLCYIFSIARIGLGFDYAFMNAGGNTRPGAGRRVA
jgi:hypothetical protein